MRKNNNWCGTSVQITRVAMMFVVCLFTASSWAGDLDSDGIEDAIDNCILSANAPQRDTDNDGIGNYCDPDFNNDGVVNFLDLSYWQSKFLTMDPDADLDGSGVVNFLDGAIFNLYFLKQPGPVGTVVWVHDNLTANDWDNRLNWYPQIVPLAHSSVVIDVPENITVTLTNLAIELPSLVVDNDLQMINSSLEISQLFELGAQLSSAGSSMSNTVVNPLGNDSGTIAVLDIAGTSSLSEWMNTTINVDVMVMDGAGLQISDDLLLHSDMTIQSVSQDSYVHFKSSSSLLGNGTVVFDGVISPTSGLPRSIISITSAPFIVGQDITIRGGNGSIGWNNSNMELRGTVLADVLNEQILINGADWRSTGILAAANGGVLALDGTLANDGDAILFDAPTGTILAESGLSVLNAELVGTEGTVLTVRKLCLTVDQAILNIDIDLEGTCINAGDLLTINGTITIHPSAAFVSRIILYDNPATITGSGTIVLNGVANPSFIQPQITTGPSTQLTIDEGVTVRGQYAQLGTINNSLAQLFSYGEIESGIGGFDVIWDRVVNYGTLTAQDGNLRIRTNATISNGLLQAKNGNTLWVDKLGTVIGDIVVSHSSVVAVTSSDPLNLSSGGSVTLEMVSASTVGRLLTQGNAKYAGNLTLRAVSGYVPAVGDVMTISNHGSYTGAYATVNSVGLNSGLAIQLDYNTSNVNAEIIENNE